MAHGFAWLQECFCEQCRVEEVLIRLPCQLAKPVQVGEFLNSDGVSNLQGELELVRRLVDQALQILLAREGVIGRIHADGFEDLGIFPQTVSVEACHCELSSVLVPGAVVERPEPPWVFPRGRADVNALRCQIGSLLGEILPGEVHAVFLGQLSADGNEAENALPARSWCNRYGPLNLRQVGRTPKELRLSTTETIMVTSSQQINSCHNAASGQKQPRW